MITKLKVQVLIVGIVAVAIGINLVLYYQSRWGEQETRERLSRMMALKPGTPLLCDELKGFLSTPSDWVVVNHWKLLRLDRGDGPRHVIMDIGRNKLWELPDCEPIENVR